MGTDGLDVLVSSLRIDGSGLSSDIADLMTACDIARPIDSAPTLTVKFRDRGRTILKSGLVSSVITTQFDTLSFQLVKVQRQGPELTLTFEDIIIAALRQHKDPRKVAAGTMSRAEFVKLLAGEEPWINVYTPPGPVLEKSQSELARGRPDVAPKQPTNKAPDPGGEDAEDSWTAMKRIMDEIGWRVFSDGHRLWVVPEPWLVAQPPLAIISEDLDAVDSIDFDWDVGKPIAEATITCRAKRWDFPPGAAVQLAGCGPADGIWVVSNIERSAYSTAAKITVSKARPVLPEPVDTTTTADVSPSLTDGTEGLPQADALPSSGTGQVTVPVVATTGWQWPCRGWILSGFGKRNGHTHEGVDIACPENTDVVAAKDGTIDFAGNKSGYGTAVFIKHPDSSVTRYGFLNKVLCKKGVQVGQGQRIGLSGGAKANEPGTTGPKDPGSSTRGPHLHFEIRVGDVAKDPMIYLGEQTKDSSADLIRLGKGHFS